MSRRHYQCVEFLRVLDECGTDQNISKQGLEPFGFWFAGHGILRGIHRLYGCGVVELLYGRRRTHQFNNPIITSEGDTAAAASLEALMGELSVLTGMMGKSDKSVSRETFLSD
jgi:hypothetical protein